MWTKAGSTTRGLPLLSFYAPRGVGFSDGGARRWLTLGQSW